MLWKISDLVRYASDASPYRFVPRVVVIAEDIDDISAVLSYARGKHRDVVFRAAGTSLNGQAGAAAWRTADRRSGSRRSQPAATGAGTIRQDGRMPTRLRRG